MWRFLIIALLVFLLSAAPIDSIRAETDPIGGCPDSFELHPAMDHEGPHEHQHVGTDIDRNGDGWICAKHVSADEDIHVHTDNNARLH